MPLFRQARQAKRDRYEFCVKKGARFVLTPDKKSFFVVWYPPSDPGAPRPPVIATLHGHASYAFDEFFLWYDEAVKRGYGIVALQWWFGRGEATNDYYLPSELNRTFDQLFKAEGILTGRNLLHGFSRGAANSYGVTLFDRVSKGNYFLLTVANSGKAESDFSPYTEVNEGKFGPQPFQGTHWVLYAGGRAPHPEKTGIQGMRETEAWLKKFGGTIDLFIEDPNGDHGGFHRNPKNISTALDVFGKLLHR